MKEMYEKKGIVVAKRMYEILKNEGKISMGYVQFSTHFKRNLVPQKEQNNNNLTPKKEAKKTQKNVEDLTAPEILKLVEEGKLSNEEITKLVDSGKVEDWDLPYEHELYMPKRRKIPVVKPWVHDAGVPIGGRILNSDGTVTIREK
ncbi:MAG TPA: hypothetical protein PLM93_07375 [Sulfuricurvum sp.]|nr:hypothetical protein [Sulfuricurvum sp.]HQT37491.1 hypothetical protein [Sulfuricurvum sp.]